MNSGDASALVAVMQGEWLRGEWLDDEGDLTTRGTMFALVLAEYDPDVGAEAIARLRYRITYGGGPQTADLKAALREVAAERQLGTPALPSDDVPVCCRGQGFGHFYRDHADAALKERITALLQVPDDRHQDTTVLEAFARMVGVPGKRDRVEVGRRIAQRKIEEGPSESVEVTVTVDPERSISPTTACGVRWGTPMVKEPGTNRYVCPNCGRDEKEGCA